MKKFLLAIVLAICLQSISNAQTVVYHWGDPNDPRKRIAYESAMYRAQHNIQGHSYLDSNRTAGVGWGYNVGVIVPTCYWERRHQGCYVSVRGANGQIYSTLILD